MGVALTRSVNSRQRTRSLSALSANRRLYLCEPNRTKPSPPKAWRSANEIYVWRTLASCQVRVLHIVLLAAGLNGFIALGMDGRTAVVS